MDDRWYIFFRKTFFWFFVIIFFTGTPYIVFYSLGYQFDRDTKKFIRTGALSIKTIPRGVRVTLNGQTIHELAPTSIRNLLPRHYSVLLQKEGFYSYTIPVRVHSSRVSEIDVILIPQVQPAEKLEFPFLVNRFFVLPSVFSEKLIAFTDNGIYRIEDGLRNFRKISSCTFDPVTAFSFRGLLESDGSYIFWNSGKIWEIYSEKAPREEEYAVHEIYQADESIQEAFLALKGRYLVIHDGLKVVALDRKNLALSLPIIELKSLNAKIFYSLRSETLFVKDKLNTQGQLSLFRIDFSSHLKRHNENAKNF